MLSIIVGIIFGALIYYKIIKPAQFWADRDIPHQPSWPLFGDLWSVIFRRKHTLDVAVDLYNKFPQDRYVGSIQFMRPSLIIRDLDLIKQIGVKEFDSFHDHTQFSGTDSEPLMSKSLINLTGDKWKAMRATLSPAFTSSKMRNMHNLMTTCVEQFVNHFKDKGQVNVEMKDTLTKFANNVIASTAFGIQIDTIKDPNSEFILMGQKLTKFRLQNLFKIMLLSIIPKIATKLKLRMLPEDVVNFFTSIITDNINRRLKEGIVRPDMIHLLLEARKGRLRHDNTSEENAEGFATVQESHIGKSNTQMELTNEHIIAQALLFHFAGFETVATAGSWLSYELAVNPQVQKKLQQEIDELKEKYSGKIPYEALLSMKYLDQVVCESLRKWPPAFQTDRFCNKEFTIEPKKPQEKTVVIEKGVSVIMPVFALHRDPQYFPDPERFDPERFSDENRNKIVPGSYMPFGVGPRNCIGSRFALLEIKTLFFYLLSEFDIIPTEKTDIPLKVSPKQVSLAPENGFNLALKPRNVQLS